MSVALGRLLGARTKQSGQPGEGDFAPCQFHAPRPARSGNARRHPPLLTALVAWGFFSVRENSPGCQNGARPSHRPRLRDPLLMEDSRDGSVSHRSASTVTSVASARPASTGNLQVRGKAEAVRTLTARLALVRARATSSNLHRPCCARNAHRRTSRPMPGCAHLEMLLLRRLLCGGCHREEAACTGAQHSFRYNFGEVALTLQRLRSRSSSPAAPGATKNSW